MTISKTLFLALFTCSLVSGILCLECHVCNDAVELGCTKAENCRSDISTCTGTIVHMKAGTRTETRIQKGCGKGVPSTVIASSDVHGFQIRGQKSECSSSNCNDKILDFIRLPTQTPGLDSSGNNRMCYSCISTNETKCSDEVAEAVKCPVGSKSCYEAKGRLTIGDFSIDLFAKQCSQSTNGSIEIVTECYKISLPAVYCSGSLCNGNLKTTVPPTTKSPNTTLPPTTDSPSTTLPPTTDSPSTTLSSPSINTTHVIPAARETSQSHRTTNSITQMSPCYALLLTLILIAPSL